MRSGAFKGRGERGKYPNSPYKIFFEIQRLKGSKGVKWKTSFVGTAEDMGIRFGL